MVKFIVVVRDIGSPRPAYWVEFDAPALPRVGDYMSIQRPDKPSRYGEGLVVRNVWWRLAHGGRRGFPDWPAKQRAGEVFVECDPAAHQYSNKSWLRMVESVHDGDQMRPSA